MSEAAFSLKTEAVAAVACALAECGRGFYQRGWVLGTSGNFSAVVNGDPLRLLITASGKDKGQLTEQEFILLNEDGALVSGAGKPSDETPLHLTLVRQRGARAVLHTHSVWATLLSDEFAAQGGLSITGWEMLKGLAGVQSHQHAEWLPILENSQDMTSLAQTLATVLHEQPAAHGFLLRGHGLYTWGRTLSEARRHVEIFEFLLEVTGRLQRTHRVPGAWQ
ncbi:MAG: methylthioribulose 1-phosphate dehydratase [Acidobacteria bacterium]|nr:methylthioribulose 1-phosphate dehydratase [Acidobacteriota bacterium]MBI3426889.1 methylthioribulose 1-phosphate dehydratase [Acidobacteriota bacterium]